MKYGARLSCCLILCLCSSIYGQNIVGADRVYAEGELVVLSLDTEIKSRPVWIIDDPILPDKTIKVLDDGSVLFGAGVTTHQIKVRCIVNSEVINAIVHVQDIKSDSRKMWLEFKSSYKVCLKEAAQQIRQNNQVENINKRMKETWDQSRTEIFDHYFKTAVSALNSSEEYAQFLDDIADGL